MEKNMQHQEMQSRASAKDSHYLRLLAMTVLSFVAMYFLMYAMVDRFDNVYASFNQFYMAGLMTAPMVFLELLLMGGMYGNKKLNGVLIAVSILALLLCWALIRQQAGVADRQFLRSMIPHHAGAILMCNESEISDPKILQLCEGIVSSQLSEIAQMKSLLAEHK